MADIGKYNRMKIVKELDFGMYLEDGLGEILLPKKYIPKGTKIGDWLEVFVYKDSENRPIATTQKPMIALNGFAFLEVKDVNKYGAFLDWGIDNQLLVPFREQPLRMGAGRKYVVMLYLDAVSDRLAATARLDRHLQSKVENPEEWKQGQEEDLLIYDRWNLGFKAIINQKYSGMLYDSDIFQHIKIGDSVKGFIKKIREDGKIDLTLRKIGPEERNMNRDKLLQMLQDSKGFIPLNDDSSPDEIQKILQMSKKSFKKAAGVLYKAGLIEITDKGIKLK
jgi:uncharacterized protein